MSNDSRDIVGNLFTPGYAGYGSMLSAISADKLNQARLKLNTPEVKNGEKLVHKAITQSLGLKGVVGSEVQYQLAREAQRAAEAKKLGLTHVPLMDLPAEKLEHKNKNKFNPKNTPTGM